MKHIKTLNTKSLQNTMKKGGQEVHEHLRTARRNQIQNVGNVV